MIVLLFAGMALSNSLAMAGSYSGSAYINMSVGVANGPESSFFIIQAGDTPTGSATGNASFSSSFTDGLDNSLPPPLFPGVYNSSQTNGFADLPAGSSTSSSISYVTRVELFFAEPTLLAFGAYTSTSTSVQTSEPYEYAVSFANSTVYFDNTQVYTTFSTAGSFGQGLSYTTTSGGSSPTMYVYAHAGINEIDAVTYTNGYAYTIPESSPPPPPGVPEPSSLVLGILGASSIGLYLGVRRRGQGGRLRS